MILPTQARRRIRRRIEISEDEEQDGRTAEGSDDDMVEAADADENGSDEEDGEFDDDPPMTIEEAKSNPIYLASEEADIHECIVCPAKKLKNKNLISVHVESSVSTVRNGLAFPASHFTPEP